MYTLQHPSIVRMFSSFVEETGPFKTGLFVVMEILDSTLEMNIANRKGKPFPEPVVQHWAKQLISVFKFIHLKGLIHCDVKSKVSSTLTKKNFKKISNFQFFFRIFSLQLTNKSSSWDLLKLLPKVANQLENVSVMI